MGPGKSHLAARMKHSWSDEGHISFSLDGVEVVEVRKSGQVALRCPEADRNKDTLAVANMVLRPLALQAVTSDARDPTSQWYVSDGKDYKVKLLEGSAVSGPKHLEAFKAKRATVLRELVEADALYADLERNQSVSTVSNAVAKMYLICEQNKWAKPRFHYDKCWRDDTLGFIFKVGLPQFEIEIAGDQTIWDSDLRIAKNKAALKALKSLEKFQAMAIAAAPTTTT